MTLRLLKSSTLMAFFLTLACSVSLAQSNHQLAGGPVLGKAGGHGGARAKGIAVKGAAPAVAGPPNMVYQGGAVLAKSTTYAIWWGPPSDFPPDAVQGLDRLLQGFEGSEYLETADQYMLGQKAHTRFGGNFFDPSPPTTMPIDSNGFDLTYLEILKVLQENGKTPDPTDIYIVYTSNFPAETLAFGLCEYHTYVYDTSGLPLFQNAYVPNSTSVPTRCGTNFDPLFTPNNNSEGTRAMASGTAHEFMEIITDPDFAGWYNPDGNEVGDLCEYIYETPVPLADSRWKLQEIWSNQASACVQGAGARARVLGASSSSGALGMFDIPAARYGTFAVSINAQGAIAGNYTDALNSYNAFLRDKNGSVATADPPGTVDALLAGAVAYGINDAGAISGVYTDANFLTHGFVRNQNGVFVTIDAPSASNPYGTVATCINADGAVAGGYYDVSSSLHGFVRDKQGAITTFDAPGAASGIFGTVPLSINASGAVTGYFLDANSVAHAFVRDPHGVITTFDAPGAGSQPGAGTHADGINDAGEIAGRYTDALSGNHSYIRDALGAVTTFDAPNAVYGTFAYSINAAGAVAGYYSDAGGFPRGFVRDKQGHFATVDANDGGYGTVILSINNWGVVAGYHTAPVE